MKHIHNKDIVLMIWETHPERRKKDFACNVNIVKERDLKVGDNIFVQTPKGDVLSIYTVVEFKTRRASSLSKYDYCELVCSWVSGNA